MIVRVLQWNVWFREKADNIINTLREIDADIICTQELTVDSFINPGINIPQLIAELGYTPIFQVAHEHKGVTYYTMGNGIFSKFPVTASAFQYVQQEDTTVTPAVENRLYMEAVIATPAGELCVGTTHLSWQDSELPEEVTAVLEAASQHHRGYILTADLNARPENPQVRRFEEQLVNAGPDYSVTTWPTKPYEFGGKAVAHLGHRCDYIFATSDVKIVSSKTVQTNASDHLPILAEIEL